MSNILWIVVAAALCVFVGYLLGTVREQRRSANGRRTILEKLEKVRQNLKPVEDWAGILFQAQGDGPNLWERPGNTYYRQDNPPFFSRIKDFFLRLKEKFRRRNKKVITDIPKSKTWEVEEEILSIADRLRGLESALQKGEFKLKGEGRKRTSSVEGDAGADKLKQHNDPTASPLQTHESPAVDPGLGDDGLDSGDQGAGLTDGQGAREETAPVFNKLSEEVTHFYNRGVENREARNSFWANYHTARIGNNKAVEQRLGEAAEPEFRSLDSGNFIAIEDATNHRYLVVPQFDMTLTFSAFNEGGVGYIFDCTEYDPGVTYRVVKVDCPAVFNSDGGGNWTLVNKGKLSLQR